MNLAPRARQLVACGLLAALAPAGSPLAEPAPRPFLGVEAPSLTVRVGDALPLALALPGGETWATAHFGFLQVRTHGRSWLALAEGQDPIPPVLRFREPGMVMVVLAAGPAWARERRDSVQLTPWCTKLLLRVEPADPDALPHAVPLPSADLMAKVGLKTELRPYLDPTELRPGPLTVLPVRAYFDGEPLPRASVVAFGPEGHSQRTRTGAHGYAMLDIPRAGRWLLRLSHETADGPYRSELVFEVSESGTRGARR